MHLTGLCAEEIHLCGESAAIDLVTELMYTTGEDVEVLNYMPCSPGGIANSQSTQAVASSASDDGKSFRT